MADQRGVPLYCGFLEKGSGAWSWRPPLELKGAVQGAHLKHSPLLQDGSLAEPGLGCKLLKGR